MDCNQPGFPIFHYLLEFDSNSCPLSRWCHLILCHPLLLLPSVFPSIRVFSSESVLHINWPKYWSFSISPFNEYSGLICFRIDWLDFLAVQGTLESFPAPQFKSINSLVLSLLYGPTLTCIHDYWENHSFDQRTFVNEVMFLLFNTLSRFIIAFLSWLQSPSAVILEPKKINSHCFQCFPINLPWSDGTGWPDFHLLNVEF